ncbi:E3 ubiquitin-protein ligase SHPRH [Stomoxys calcitrans]|uniref:E3 ubiquitin-protein ligase SHPRH n=1 Tax=Stomoxys calcitrans TaxID=35570 RepID=UPI0027E3382E|nr:E3 ubiquitin-protein ligase SHPRH [Stomoxys calcitrans]
MSGAGIVLSKIAKLCLEKDEDSEKSDSNCFLHRQKQWQILTCYEKDAEKLIEIVKISENSRSKIVEFAESEDGNHLLALYNNFVYYVHRRQKETIDILFRIFFRRLEHESEGNGNEDEECVQDEGGEHILKTYVTTKLFEALQKRHNHLSKAFEDIQIALPLRFLPKLCNYQLRSVKWMCTKERSPSKFGRFFDKVQAKDNETTVYKHRYIPHLEPEQPVEITLPPGGILADEMGLGKTVEILALILLNPRQYVEIGANLKLEFENYKTKRQRIDDEIFCICTSKSNKKILKCSKCHLGQHSKCVARYDDDHDDEVNDPYICPECWQNVIAEWGLIKSKATFIVSPTSIKSQWLSEIKRHIQPSLRVLLYDGAFAGKWISPRQLADYDVILTDYNILRREIFYTQENVSERTMRNKPRCIRVQTPILMVEWYRVCLDEAQMVESNTSGVAALVRMLPAIHRWAVTGTPIQRSLNDLQPLLQFVGFEEVAEKSTWNSLVKNFLLHHRETIEKEDTELINALQKCMWRTCKSQIVDELRIPPQTQIVHRIQFDNLEKLFYNEQHADCRMTFMGNVRKYKMTSISPQVMKLILQPFLKIRQSCTMPVVVMNSKANSTLALPQKQFLHPQELHRYLKSSNELSCKSELRAMASTHNGLAAIYYIQQKYDDATKNYNAVLKLARDYTHMNITVDSLLQIHALYNLMEIKIMQKESPANLETYQTQYNALEWKYLSTYANTLSTVMQSYESAINNTNIDIGETLIASMSEGLMTVKNSEIMFLLQKIYEDCMPRFGVSHAKLSEVQSIHSLLYIVDVWQKKLTKMLKKLETEIQNLRYFTENVKSRSQVSPGIWEKIMELVHSVYNCHLSEIREKEKDKQKTENRSSTKKPLCKLCSIRDIINSFECLLFDKVIDKDSKLTEGLENNSFEMFVCKITFSYLKNKLSDIHLSKTMEQNWLHLEHLQTVCKRLIKLWIEIEYTIKAYDELNMCKLRIELTTDPDEKSIYKIFEHEIDQRTLDQQNELLIAQRQFTMKLARLKYIKHLESDQEIGPCPICHSVEEDRYAVLECGHHICFQCLRSIQQYDRSGTLKCSVCRYLQHHQHLYYVSKFKRKEQEVQKVKGNYSSKITYIVGLILKLQTQHNLDTSAGKPNLQILIFSQWLPILIAISAALKENDISYRIHRNPQSVEEFKNPNRNITCLLMPFVKGSKGLNLVEATHVFLVEPILNPGEELQAIGRVHRFGQTRATTVHRFIMDDSIEENIHNFISSSPLKENVTSGVEHKWEMENVSLDDFENLFVLKEKN